MKIIWVTIAYNDGGFQLVYEAQEEGEPKGLVRCEIDQSNILGLIGSSARALHQRDVVASLAK